MSKGAKLSGVRGPRETAGNGRGLPGLRAPAPRPIGDEAEAGADRRHRAILRTLGLPPFVSKRTLAMFLEFQPPNHPGPRRESHDRCEGGGNSEFPAGPASGRGIVIGRELGCNRGLIGATSAARIARPTSPEIGGRGRKER